MSILVTVLVKLFNFECFVSLSKHFFTAFAASQNCKSEKASFSNLKESQNFSQVSVQCTTALENCGSVANMLGSQILVASLPA